MQKVLSRFLLYFVFVFLIKINLSAQSFKDDCKALVDHKILYFETDDLLNHNIKSKTAFNINEFWKWCDKMAYDNIIFGLIRSRITR